MTRSHASKSDCGRSSKGAYSPAHQSGPATGHPVMSESQPLNEAAASIASHPLSESFRLP